MMRLLALVLCVAVVVQANIVAKERCDGALSDDSICEIQEVRVIPCKNPKKCVLQRGKSASIAIDYIPHFAADKMITDASYNNISFRELNTDACASTACPSVPSKPSIFSYQLEINSKLPNGVYPVVWKFWDESNDKNVCCFKMVLKLK